MIVREPLHQRQQRGGANSTNAQRVWMQTNMFMCIRMYICMRSLVNWLTNRSFRWYSICTHTLVTWQQGNSTVMSAKHFEESGNLLMIAMIKGMRSATEQRAGEDER